MTTHWGSREWVGAWKKNHTHTGVALFSFWCESWAVLWSPAPRIRPPACGCKNEPREPPEIWTKGSLWGQMWLIGGWPVVPSDTGGAGPSRRLVLFIVMRIDMGFFGLLLQDLPKVVAPDAPEKGSHLIGFLDHPLRNEKIQHSSYSELSLQNISLCEQSSSAKADGIQTVASQQTYCLRYTRAASCRKQPETNSAAHRGTILIQALSLSCVLK